MALASFMARHRLLVAACLVSAALHAALLVGVPGIALDALDRGGATIFTATLEPAAPPAAPVAAPHPAVPPKPAPRRAFAKARVHRAPTHIAALAPAAIAPTPATITPAIPEEPAAEGAAPADTQAGAGAPPQHVAMAEPVVPPPAAPLPPLPDTFPLEGLPDNLSIDYRLTSAVASAQAYYHWQRDGDSYRITGEAQAVGLLQLFLEGRIVQEASGTVTHAGLRPERFVERKPGTQDEGLEFDWPAHKVTFELGDKRKTTPLTDNTVDWLTMIFQLAHTPPRLEGDSMVLSVFTQRRLYRFDLKVLGVEEIEIPLGKVRALHLRNIDPEDGQAVDVWLGLDQHYLPVKMRYPVAKNRLMVVQSATRISEQ